MRPRLLGILGIGALGGSVARRAQRAGVSVLGWSPRPAERAAAVREGIVHDAVARADEVTARCDLVVLAGTPAANTHWLERHGPRLAPGALMTDVGLAKCAIVARAATLGLASRFAGSRPAAEPLGDGLAAARADLFDGLPVYVAPVPGGEDAAREIAHFWQCVCGAHPVVLDAERHDVLAALGVQLPDLVAAVLATVLAERLPAGTAPGATARALSAPAQHLDRGRVEALWQNRAEAGTALRAAADAAARLADALGADDPRALEGALAAAARWRRGHGA